MYGRLFTGPSGTPTSPAGDSQSSSESYKVRTSATPATKFVRVICDHLNRDDLSLAMTANLIVRASPAIQDKLSRLIDLILISWAQEYERGCDNRIYAKAHRMVQAERREGQRCRVPTEADTDTQYFRNLALSTRRVPEDDYPTTPIP